MISIPVNSQINVNSRISKYGTLDAVHAPQDMTRRFKSPADQAPLPKVSFVLVQDDDSAQLAGVHDQQARSYGCTCLAPFRQLSLLDTPEQDNDFSEFLKPDHYIRYIGTGSPASASPRFLMSRRTFGEGSSHPGRV